jgi:hypothetical protein
MAMGKMVVVKNLSFKENKMQFTNKVYDVLKFVAQIFLPALGTLYFALAGIWGFPYGEQVVGTIMAIDAFLGVLLGLSTAKYNKDVTNNAELPQ